MMSSTERLETPQATGVLHLHAFFWYGTVFLYLRHDMRLNDLPTERDGGESLRNMWQWL